MPEAGERRLRRDGYALPRLVPDGNHVHLILVPQSADGLRAALGEAHRRYTRASTSAKAGGHRFLGALCR